MPPMVELLACTKLPDTRRRSGSAASAMPGSRSAVIQPPASGALACAAEEMMVAAGSKSPLFRDGFFVGEVRQK